MKSISLLVVLFLLVSQTSAQKSSYNPTLALHLAYYSEVAYKGPTAIQGWSCSHCQKYHLSHPKVFSFSAKGIQGYTGYSKSLNTVVVAFRGSSNIQSLQTDLIMSKESYPACSGCQVHSGFLQGYNQVASKVKKTVKNLMAKYRGAKLMVTGHSLGGALAILAAADLANSHAIDAVYTFGQPRVGNKVFSTWYPTVVPNTFRVIHYADLIPHILSTIFLGFYHSSTQIWYQKDMQTYSTCVAQSQTCSNSLFGDYSIDDHPMKQYLKLKSATNIESEKHQTNQVFNSLSAKDKKFQSRTSNHIKKHDQKILQLVNKKL